VNRDHNAAINILNKGKNLVLQARNGQFRSNALGVVTSISVDENQLKQVATLSKESPLL
jgi:transposase